MRPPSPLWALERRDWSGAGSGTELATEMERETELERELETETEVDTEGYEGVRRDFGGNNALMRGTARNVLGNVRSKAAADPEREAS